MKFVVVAFVCIALSALSSCTTAKIHPPRIYNGGDSDSRETRQEPSRLETIAYYWESFRVKVSFSRSVPDEHWTMTLFDSWDIYDQYKDEGKVGGMLESTCSMEECLQMIDRSLTEFHAEKPTARVDMVAIEMHVIRDLWSDILAGVSRKLSTLDGKKTSSRADVPSGLGDEIESVLVKSPAVKGISALLRKHQIEVRAVNIENQIAFKDSLAGRRWAEIAALPGTGVLIPGTIGFGP